MEALGTETDRGIALVTASYFDERLKDMLGTVFVAKPQLIKKLFDYPGPISSFASRIDIAYAIGVITGSLHEKLHLIRNIRNGFGHSHTPETFETPGMLDKCKQLTAGIPEFADVNLEARQWFLFGMMNVSNALTATRSDLRQAIAGQEFRVDRRVIGQVVVVPRPRQG